MSNGVRDGLLLVDKHGGCTSHDIVQQARRLLRQKKIGHCGTLDPSATGLLVLTLGRATRLTRFLIRAPKVYTGTIRFGIETDTFDAAGEVVREASTEGLTEAAIDDAMARLVGTFLQRAPRYSAKKVGGRKMYELARRGEEVPEETKEVTVYEFRRTEELAQEAIPFRLACASGTYARALAQDLGEALGCGAHLSSLRREKVGTFEVGSGATLEALEDRLADAGGPATAELLDACWIPFDEIPLPFGEITTDAQQERRIQHGQTVLVRDLTGEEGDWVKLVNTRQRFIAVGTVVERIGDRGVGIVQPRVVFHG